jgi:hypothetical protein
LELSTGLPDGGWIWRRSSSPVAPPCVGAFEYLVAQLNPPVERNFVAAKAARLAGLGQQNRLLLRDVSVETGEPVR